MSSIEKPVDPANIVAGSAVATNTVTPQTLITIPTGRQWVGEVSVSIASTAAAIVAATVQTGGTNVVPVAGTVVARVQSGGLTSGGFSAQATFKVRVSAPPQNAVTLSLAAISAASNTCSATANGVLV